MADTGGPARAQAPNELEFVDLIAPLPEHLFFADWFEKRVLHVKAQAPDRFASLAAAIDVEEILHGSCRHWGDVSLARADVEPADCPYVAGAPTADAIGRAYREGYTVVINDLQARRLAVARLCRQVEARFVCRANVNLYLTGPNGRGLRRHYDDDDVIVLQLDGEKTWRTFPHEDRLPLGGGGYRLDPSDAQGETHVLSAGDLLYVPRGAPHEATASSAGSLHLTISLCVLRWAHLMRELIDVLAEQEPALRRVVPLEVLRDGGDWPAGDLMRRALAGLDRGAQAQALARAQGRLLAAAERLPAPWSQPQTCGPVDERTLVQVSPDQIWCAAPDGHGAVLQAVLARVEFPAALAWVPGFLAGRRTFCAAEMPSTTPLAQRLEIVQRLVADGFLVRVGR